MEIREITDQKIWDEFVIATAPQSFFQSWLWGEVIKSNSKCVWRIGIYDNENLIGVVQVHKVMAKKGIFLHLRHGPVLKTWDKKTIEFLLEYLKHHAKTQRAHFIRISPLIENSTHNKDFLHSYGFIPSPLHEMDGEYCWVLDITKSNEELLAGMRKSTRYLIKQAQKLGVVVKPSDTIDAFLKLYQETASRHGFVPHQQVTDEWEISRKAGNGILLEATHDGQLLAAALIVVYGNQAIYRHAASVKSKIPAAYLLQWEAIAWGKAKNMSLYNFWGIAPPTKQRHPWQGITLFKQGFGGELKEYIHAQDLPLSPLYYVTALAETVRRISKGY